MQGCQATHLTTSYEQSNRKFRWAGKSLIASVTPRITRSSDGARPYHRLDFTKADSQLTNSCTSTRKLMLRISGRAIFD